MLGKISESNACLSAQDHGGKSTKSGHTFQTLLNEN